MGIPKSWLVPRAQPGHGLQRCREMAAVGTASMGLVLWAGQPHRKLCVREIR